MKKKSIKLNYIFNASYKIFAIIVPLITAPYISRVLGSDGVGTYSYTFAMVTYFTMFATLGAGTLGNKIIAMNQEDPVKRSIEFWNIAIFRAVPTVFVTILYFIYAIFIADDQQIALLQSFYLLGVLVDVAWFLQGMEEFQKVAVRNFVIKIVNVICIFAFVKERSDLPVYVLCLSLMTVIGNMSIWVYLKKYLVKIKIKQLNPFKHTKDVLQLFIPTIACSLYAVVDKTMIGWFSNASENGYYEQSDKIINMSLLLITSLCGVMLPRIAQEFAKNNKAAVQDYMHKTYRFIWFLGLPLMMGIIAVSDVFVPVFFGEGYDKVKILLPVMSCLFIIKGFNDATGSQYLVATGQHKKYMNIVIIGGIANIAFNLALIPSLKSLGAAIGSIIGEVVIFALEFNFIRRTKQIDIKPIFTTMWKYGISSIVMLGALLCCEKIRNGKIENILALLLLIAFGAIVYAAMLLLLKDNLITDTLKSIMGKLKRSKL